MTLPWSDDPASVQGTWGANSVPLNLYFPPSMRIRQTGAGFRLILQESYEVAGGGGSSHGVAYCPYNQNWSSAISWVRLDDGINLNSLFTQILSQSHTENPIPSILTLVRTAQTAQRWNQECWLPQSPWDSRRWKGEIELLAPSILE